MEQEGRFRCAKRPMAMCYPVAGGNRLDPLNLVYFGLIGLP